MHFRGLLDVKRLDDTETLKGSPRSLPTGLPGFAQRVVFNMRVGLCFDER